MGFIRTIKPDAYTFTISISNLHDKKELIKIIKKYSISHFLIDANKSFELPRAKSVWESENFTLVEVNI